MVTLPFLPDKTAGGGWGETGGFDLTLAVATIARQARARVMEVTFDPGAVALP